MPKELIKTIYSGYEIEQNYNLQPANSEVIDGAQTVQQSDEISPEGI